MGTQVRIKRNTTHKATTLEQAFKEFLREKEAKNLSEATLFNYRTTYKFFTEFHQMDEDTLANDIEISHIYDWIDALKEDAVKPASINHYLRDMRAFLYWCMAEERRYIKHPYKIIMIEAQEEQLKIFAEDEMAKLLEKPRNSDGFTEWRTWAMVNWVLATGNRAATICDVKLIDIDYSSKEIALRHTKNKKLQIIPLSPSLEKVLREYIRIWRSDTEDGWLFPNIGEEQLTTNALRHAFRKYCLSRGVNKTNIHGLRHSFARGWVKNNGNMFALQKVLGHSNLEMTKKYVKLFDDDIKEDYDKYAPLDTMSKPNKRTMLVKRNNG